MRAHVIVLLSLLLSPAPGVAAELIVPDLPQPGTVAADVVEAALSEFKAAFSAGRWAEAEAAAREAYGAGAGAAALEGLAAVSLRQGRVPRAHRLYAAIVADPKAPEDVARRARTQVEAFERQTGRLVLRGAAPDAVVSVDDDALGAASGPVVHAWPGRHRVGVGDFTVSVQFSAGKDTQVVVPEAPKSPATPSAPATP
jgi:hypothetical protein